MPSDAKKKANKKWDAQNLKVVGCRIKISTAEAFESYAKRRGTTINALIKTYVEKCIQEDRETPENPSE